MTSPNNKNTRRGRFFLDRYIRFEPRNRDWRFMSYRKLTLGISGIILLLSLGSLIVKGLNQGIDFRGGILVEVQMSTPISLGDFRARMADLNAEQISQFGAEDIFLMRFDAIDDGEVAENSRLTSIRAFLANDANATIRRAELVGPTIGKELVNQALWAIIAALAGIMLYIWLRFEWNFGLAGLLALVHDVVIILGVYSLFDISFSIQTVAAVLAMAGYSINDSVVVFDRIRENLRKFSRKNLTEIIDRTLNEVISRSFITSFTTLLAVISLLLFGGAVLRDFVWAMVIGIIVGTWSSLVVAPSLLIWFPPKRQSVD